MSLIVNLKRILMGEARPNCDEFNFTITETIVELEELNVATG